MRYYFLLICVFIGLTAIDLFFARLFSHADLSVALAFLLTLAFIAPQKTRFILRSMIPLVLVCGFAAETLSALGSGVVFIVYGLLAAIIIAIAQNLPRADDTKYFIIVILAASFIGRIIMGMVFNRLGVDVLLAILPNAAIFSVFTTVCGALFAYFLETPAGQRFGKVLFNEE